MSNLKKVLALVLVMALSLTMFAGAIETVLPFDDLDELTTEQYTSLELLYAIGVIKGNDKNSVNAGDTLTRAELCAILYRLYTGDVEETNVSTYNTKTAFADCDSNAWYNPYVNWAYLKGVVVGYGDGNFGPLDTVTGVQAATMLARLLGYTIGSENWVYNATQLSMNLGLDKGVKSKDLYGTGISRGDMFVMVYNALHCEEVGKETTILDRVFDVEIIYGAILATVDKLGGTKYSLFAFKDEILGSVKWYFYGLLSIESNATVDEIGQKYTLYVSKSTDSNGYRRLYAAFQEKENDYYKTVTGTVDDEKLDVKDKDSSKYPKQATNAVYYINGAYKDSNGVAYTYADFAASYGARNGGTYKLIDTDGDGKYEYFFIQRLTLGTMTLETVVASVTSYNTSNGAYTLSNGNTYKAGDYWGVNDDDEINTSSYVRSTKQLENLLGTSFATASNVLYKFTIESGKYIMKVEICDETYFAGNYVLGMGTIGSGTYKGYSCVKFLTEDNTELTAYVRNIDHESTASNSTLFDQNFLSNGEFANNLFYIQNAEGDYVDLFTPGYVNSNYVNEELCGSDTTSIQKATGSKFTALNGVDDVFQRITTTTNNAIVTPAESYVSGRSYVQPYVSTTASKNIYYYNYLDGTYSTKKPSYTNEDEKAALLEALINEGVTMGSTDPNDYWDIAAVVTAATDAVIYKQYAMDYVIFFSAESYSSYFNQTGNPTLAYVKYAGIGAVEIAVSIELNYNKAGDLQLFKIYGNWYAQQYAKTASSSAAVITLYFTSTEEKTMVSYVASEGVYRVVTAVNTDGSPKTLGAVYYTGDTDASAVNTAILAAIDTFKAANPFVWTDAKKLNTSKGVVFAYGRYSDNSEYLWRAYNFDEFNVTTFGEGGPNDDHDFGKLITRYLVDDQMIYTIDANGNYYVKAMKVTVANGADDILPYGWTTGAKNSAIFIYYDALGESTTSTWTVRAYGPNGTFETYTAGYGYKYFTQGDVVYAVLADDGKTIVSAEVLTSMPLKGVDLLTGGNVKELGDYIKTSYDAIGYTKGGTCKVQGDYGIVYTKSITPDLTYYIGTDGANLTEAKFIEKLDDMTTKKFCVIQIGDRYIVFLGKSLPTT